MCVSIFRAIVLIVTIIWVHLAQLIPVLRATLVLRAMGDKLVTLTRQAQKNHLQDYNYLRYRCFH